jgi:hypothetical protein
VLLEKTAVWISNSRNNFAPFAGFMLMGYEKTCRVKSSEELDGEVDEVSATGETAEHEIDDAAV